MLETHLRSYFQPIFDKLAHLLINLKISPEMITACGLIYGKAAAICIALNKPILALILLWLSGLCDVLDGTVARITKTTKTFGAYLDLISDRMVECFTILGFTFAYPENYFAYVLFLASVLFHFSTFTVAGALFKNDGPKSMHYDKSFIERAEAFLVFSLMLIFPQLISYLLMPLNVLIIASGITRFIRVKNYAKNLDKEMVQLL